MTREGAISVLECMAVDLTGCMGGLSKKDPLEDVCRQRLEAINTAQSALRPVSREQVEKVWNPCNFCAGAKYITGGVTAVYPVSETRQQETLAEGDFDFCPVCGRPLTDEAVEMVMERLEELSNGKG